MNASPITGKKLAWLFSLIYFTSYTSRINFAAIIQEIVTASGFAKTELSMVLVSLSVTYGIGMVVNGKIGDHVNPQDLILCGLFCSAAVNAVFPFCSSSVTAMTILWGINGFAQAMMWPPIVKILVANTNDESYGYSVVRVSWGSSIGTIFVYLSAPFVISLLGWKAVFFLSAGIGALVTLLWAILKKRIRSDPPADPKIEESQAMRFPKQALFPLVFIIFAIIFQGMLRDGVTSWMPTYLVEVFDLDTQSSILYTVSLAVFSILAFSLAGSVYKRFFKNEVACALWIYVVSLVASLVLFAFYESGAVVAIFMMAVITGCMHGVNLMLISHIPKRFKKYGNISFISGAINACTYVGAAIAGYAFSWLSEIIGWKNTVGVWALLTGLGVICCAVAIRPWKSFTLESTNNN